MDRSIRIPVGGVVAIAIPYIVGISFDQYQIQAIQVFGCPENELGELPIVGRDIMNRYRIEFNGPKLEFEIF